MKYLLSLILLTGCTRGNVQPLAETSTNDITCELGVLYMAQEFAGQFINVKPGQLDRVFDRCKELK